MRTWKAITLALGLSTQVYAFEDQLDQSCLSFHKKSIGEFRTIGDQQKKRLLCHIGGSEFRVGVRTFTSDGLKQTLLFHPEKLTATVVQSSCLQCEVVEDSDFRFEFEDSPLKRAIEKYTSKLGPMAEKLGSNIYHNDGMVSSEVNQDGFSLTIDMCPTGKTSYERGLFQLFNRHKDFEDYQEGIPLGVAITGKWIRGHLSNLKEIIRMEQQGKIKVTWINHSYSHPYFRDRDLTQNFLVAPGVNIDNEILKNENSMLSYGLIPSPFFRYPGLVSSLRLQRVLNSYHLIPLGSDAWIAKGQKPKDGSIILVHGNLNERSGIVKLEDFFKTVQPPLRLVSIEEFLGIN